MRLNELSPVEGSVKRPFRKGRGTGSGNGKTAGRGHKGQNARSGGGVRPGFEGGQMPLARRLPKRGFNNIHAKTYVGINIETLNVFEDGAVVDATAIREAKILKNTKDGVKLLGRGELTKKLTIKVHGCSESAKAKIEAAGGTVEILKKPKNTEAPKA